MPNIDGSRITPEHIRQAAENLTNGGPPQRPPGWPSAARVLLLTSSMTLVSFMTGRAFVHDVPLVGVLGIVAMIGIAIFYWTDR